MGNSPSRVVGKKVSQFQPSTVSPDYMIFPDLTESDPFQVLSYDLKLLIKDVNTLPHCKKYRPICIYSLFSTPLLISDISLSNSKEEENIENDCKMYLSEIAISRSEFGRVICFGNIETLLNCTLENENGQYFVEKMLRWIGGRKPNMRMLCMYKVAEKYRSRILVNLEGLGFGIEAKDEIENLSDYDIIFCTSDQKFDENLTNFVKSGGGLIVCGVFDSDDLYINDVIQDLGLSFTKVCEFENKSENEEEKLSLDYRDLVIASLDSHLELFQKIISENPEDEKVFEIGKIISDEVRFSLHSSVKHANLLCDFCGNYVNSDYFIEGKPFGSNRISEMMTKLTVETLDYNNPNVYENTDYSTTCIIGESQITDPEQIRIKCEFNDPMWYDLGVWIQPGFIYLLTFDNRIPDCDVIIGAHTYDCTENKGPWIRFPKISLRAHVTEKIMRLATPFGGMLYLQPRKSELEEKKGRFELSLYDISYFPIRTSLNSEIWKTTQHYEIKWGEFKTRLSVFVVEKAYLIAIEDEVAQGVFIDKLLSTIFDICGNTPNYRIRVVFDVVFPNKFKDEYPITLDYKLSEKIMLSQKPTPEMFYLCACAAFTLLPATIPYLLRSTLSIATAIAAFKRMNLEYKEDLLKYVRSEYSHTVIKAVVNESEKISACISSLINVNDSTDSFISSFNKEYNTDITEEFKTV